jgi:excisionase family DNA binding protein
MNELGIGEKGKIPEKQAGAQTAGLMTIQEAAAFLNLKVSKIRALTFRNEIPFVKIGRLVRFRAQDLELWVLDHVRTPPRSRSAGHDKERRSFFEIDTRFNRANFERS